MDEAPVANDDNGKDILEKLKSTIEKIKQMIHEDAEITRKKFTEWGKTLKEIVEEDNEVKIEDDIDSKTAEQYVAITDKEYGMDYSPE